MSAPRVAVLANVFGSAPSGVLRHATEVLPRAAALLAADGGGLELWCADGPLELGPELEPGAAALPRRAAGLPAGSPLARWFGESRAVRRTAADAERAGLRPDVLHSGHLPLVRAPRRLRLCWMLHDLRQLDAGLVGPLRALLARRAVPAAAARADAIVTPSRTLRADLERHAPGARTKTTAIWHGADHFDPLPRAAAGAEPAPLLHLGHLEPRKNLELLIEALALAPELPPLELWGAQKGDCAQRLEARARELGVAARVSLPGPFDDSELPQLLARAAAVVLPSRLEGFGLLAVEALRAGCPLAVSRAGALCEVAGPTAFSFAPDSPEQCAAAIAQALSAPSSQLERGRRHADAFTWDRSARRLVEVWTRCANTSQ